MNQLLDNSINTFIDTNPLIYKIGEVQYSGAASASLQVAAEITIAHNLGYIPKFTAYVSNDNVTFRRMSCADEESSGGDIYLNTNIAKANEIELKFRFTRFRTTSPGTATLPTKYVKYYIFRERIS